MDTTHRFQFVTRGTASFAEPMLISVEARSWCRQANLRMGEKGQPGASGMAASLRKRIAACR